MSVWWTHDIRSVLVGRAANGSQRSYFATVLFLQ